jgi:alkylated DNA repair dioxygenase AlkB
MNSFNGVPIEYYPNWVKDPDGAYKALREELAWVRHDKVPRSEYYSNLHDVPYTYGMKDFARTYQTQPWHPVMEQFRQDLADAKYEGPHDVCFLNMYEDGSDQLGNHADDSPEMDDARSIAIISLGAEREIWFKLQPQVIAARMEKFLSENWGLEADVYDMYEDKLKVVTKLRLGHGSLCIMKPGMQDTHFHRIPKSDRQNCGPRISLTYRGYVAVAE